MIGGIERTFEARMSPVQALHLCGRICQAFWPEAVFQEGASPFFSRNLSEVIFKTELLIFRDEAALRAWDTLGAHEAVAKTMIYLVAIGNDQLTVVVENPDHFEMVPILAQMETALQRGCE